MSCHSDGEERDQPPGSGRPFDADPALPSPPEDSLATAMRRNRELEALFQASQRLNSSLSVAEICQAGLDALHQLLGYQHLCIYFSRPGGLVLQAQRGFAKLPAVIPGDRGIMARAAAARHTVLVPEAAAEPDYIASMPHVRSEIAVPLLHANRVFGVLNVETLAPQALGPDDERLLSTFANNLVVAIENARLYEETQQLYADARGRLNEMQTLFEFVASLTRVTGIEQVAHNALDSISRLVPFDIGQVGLRDEPNGMILPIILRGGRFESELISSRALELLHEPASAQGEGVAEWVAAHGQAYRVADVQSDPRSRPLAPAIRSQLCVPLKAGDRVIGIVDLESERGDAFDERAEQLLTTIASPLAIAIANAQLYEQTRDDAQVKAALLRELSHRVKNNLAAITSLLQLALSQPPEEREDTLQETLGRAESMVLAHTLLASSDLARVNLVALGDQVLSDAVRHLAPPDNRILVDVSGDAVEIAPRQLTTIALVLNELATNAILHGLSGPERTASGLLELRVRRTMNGACITLSDDGTGLAAGFTLENSAGIGLALIRTLVEKDLHGSFSIERRKDKTVAVVDVTLDE
ncbi:MAG: sensor histidine kinase [Rudaea sp.]